MKYPKIKVPRHCFVIVRPNMNSPRIQLSANAKHVEWLKNLRQEADSHAKNIDLPRTQASLLRMYWRTVRTFADKLLSGSVAIQVWSVRGEMSKMPGYHEEAFDAVVKTLFKS